MLIPDVPGVASCENNVRALSCNPQKGSKCGSIDAHFSGHQFSNAATYEQKK